jgi:hypothetical protein
MLTLRFWLAFPLVIALSACASSSGGGSGPITGTYTGVMQQGGVDGLDDNLAAVVTVTESTELLGVSELTFSSSAFPSFKAIVLSTGSDAVDLQLVGVDSNGDPEAQEVAFTKDSNGRWVLIIQLGGGSGLVQFASYDPMNAPPATAIAAVDYLDQMIKLATSAGSN